MMDGGCFFVLSCSEFWLGWTLNSKYETAICVCVCVCVCVSRKHTLCPCQLPYFAAERLGLLTCRVLVIPGNRQLEVKSNFDFMRARRYRLMGVP